MKPESNIRISGAASKESLEALKDLIYQNPNQLRDEEGILRALKEFGQPRIREIADKLCIYLDEDVPQSLFAYDEADPSGHPVGVVIFSRSDAETIVIIQMSVDPDYAMHGIHGQLGVAFLLIEKVRAIAAQVAGIKTIKVSYRRHVELKV